MTKTVSYSQNEDFAVEKNGWVDFFQNSDQVNCPIEECTIKAVGCVERYEGDKIDISAKPPWTLKYKVDEIQGYAEQVCLVCSSKLQTKVRDKFKVVQESKCKTTLSKAPTAKKSISINYSNAGNPVTVVSGYQSLFNNSDPANCPVTKCWLRE